MWMFLSAMGKAFGLVVLNIFAVGYEIESDKQAIS
jgi:hypothetical protein